MKLLRDYLQANTRHFKEEIGVEIEMTGTNLPHYTEGNWIVTQDGSVPNGLEYLFKQPQNFDEAMSSIEELYHIFTITHSKLKPNSTCSTHVHINVQDMTIPQILNFYILAGIFEPTLVDYCGASRHNNIFCMSIQNAYGMVHLLTEVINNQQLFDLLRNDREIRYSFCNLASVPKFGSVEFRGMRATKNPEPIKIWCKALLNLRKFSLEYTDPTNIIRDFSEIGHEEMFQKVFKGLRNFKPFSYYDSLRYLQGLAFLLNHDERILLDKKFNIYNKDR